MKNYLTEILDKLDPFKLGFDVSTIPPPPKCTLQSIYPRGDNTHPEGVNRYIYFVIDKISCNKVEWKRLPDIEAKQLRLARFVQSKLTGNLDARIWDKIPPFPGCEAHYLRCLISRIKHGTEIAPTVCIKSEPIEQEEEDEETQKKEAAERFIPIKVAEDLNKDDVEPDQLKEKTMKRRFIAWPEINKELEANELEFDALKKLESWSHCCPVLMHRGVVIPYEVPEEAEPEPEEEEPDNAEEEEEEKPAEEAAKDEEEKPEGAENPEEQKEPEEPKEPPPPTAQQRLDTLYKECDQKKNIEENSTVLKEVGKQKCVYYVPKAHWELVKEVSDYSNPKKDNKGIYKVDRFFNTEMPPVDINCHTQELPPKEQAYWEKVAATEE